MARGKKDKGADVSVLAATADYTFTLDPKDGSEVPSIDKIVITYPNAEVTRYAKGSSADISLTDSGGNVTYFSSVAHEDDGTGGSVITITFDEVTTLGECNLYIKENSFMDEKGGIASYQSPEITATYTIIGASVTIPLTDLDGYVTGSAYVTPAEGSGDGAVSVTADEGNEGLDRSGVVTFSTTKGEPTISVARTIVQEGLREPFAGSDGDFIVADGGTFHVLK